MKINKFKEFKEIEPFNICKCCGGLCFVNYDYCPYCWENCKRELREFYESPLEHLNKKCLVRVFKK